MKAIRMLSCLLVAAFAFAAMSQTADAAIWINEGFEDGVAFDHADGLATGGALDFYYDGRGATATAEGQAAVPASDAYHKSPTEVVTTGTVVADRGLESNSSLMLNGGQSWKATRLTDSFWMDRVSLLQMGVSLGEVPQTADVTVAELDLPIVSLDDDGTTATDESAHYNFNVKLVSDGANGADIIVSQNGEDGATSEIVAGNRSADTGMWAVITIVVNEWDQAYPDPTLGSIPAQTVQVFVSGDTPAMTFTFPVVGALAIDPPSFDVYEGTVYVDNVYMEGDMENAASQPTRAFLALTTVPMELSEFDLE